MSHSDNALVRKLSNFMRLSTAELTCLAEIQAKPEKVNAQTDIVHEGQTGHRAFILLSGWAYSYKLLPESDFAGYKPPEPTIPNSIGHHAEWLLACKTGSPTTCNFDYAGALTEAVLLGTVSYRVGQKLEWDPAALKAPNCAVAEQYLHREYRKGWTL